MLNQIQGSIIFNLKTLFTIEVTAQKYYMMTVHGINCFKHELIQNSAIKF